VFVAVLAAKSQSSLRHSVGVTSSCDVITPPSSITDVDIDVINRAAIVYPGFYYIHFELAVSLQYVFSNACI